MKRIFATLLFSAIVLTFMPLSSSAAGLVDATADDFEGLNHILPQSASVDYSPATDVDNPLTIFDDSVETCWYENQINNEDQQWKAGSKITAKLDKAYLIKGIRGAVGKITNSARITKISASFTKNGQETGSVTVTLKDEPHLPQYFLLTSPVEADSVTLTMEAISTSGCQWWGEPWAFLGDFSLYTDSTNVPLDVEFIEDPVRAYGVDVLSCEEFLPYVIPIDASATVSAGDTTAKGAFIDPLVYIPTFNYFASPTYWAQSSADEYATFNVKYNKPYEITGLDIIPGVATWEAGYEQYKRNIKPTLLNVVFKLKGNEVDRVTINLDWRRYSSATIDNYSYQLGQYYILNRHIVADAIDVTILDTSSKYHDDGVRGNGLIGLTRFGAIGVEGQTPAYWERGFNVESLTEAEYEDATEVSSENASETNSDVETEKDLTPVILVAEGAVIVAAVIIIIVFLRKKKD